MPGYVCLTVALLSFNEVDYVTNPELPSKRSAFLSPSNDILCDNNDH